MAAFAFAAYSRFDFIFSVVYIMGATQMNLSSIFEGRVGFIS